MRSPSLTLRTLAAPATAVAVLLGVTAAVAETCAAVVAGQVAAGPSASLVGILAVLLIGSAIADAGGTITFSGVVGRAEGRLRADLLHTVFHQPLPVLEEQAVGELLDRVDDDPRQLALLTRRTGWMLLRAALRTVLGWVIAGLTWWPAWIVFPVVAVASYLLVRRLTPVVARHKFAEEVAWSDHSAQFEEAIAGRDDVRTTLGQPHVVRQYARRASEAMRRAGATSAASAQVGLRIGLPVCVALAVVAIAGTLTVVGGGLGLAELITLWLLVATFAGQLSHIGNNLPDLQAGLGALQRIRTLLAATPEPDGGSPVPAGPATVEFRDLDFSYAGRRVACGPENQPGFALRGISLTVPAGTTCALVGRTGSGKSTLATLLSRAVEPPQGTVFVAGQDVTGTDITGLRRAVGVVTQRTEILSATLAENVTLFRDVPPGAVEDAMDALGLREWVDALPDGIHTRLGAGGTTLSAGEEQLVAFARLLVRDVAVVVLDEATARMDPQTERRVTQAAGRLLAGRTGLVIAHRLSTTRRADTVAVLDSGKLVQHGERARLATEPGPFADLLATAGESPEPGTTGEGPHLRAAPRRARQERAPAPPPSLLRSVLRAMGAYPAWGIVGGLAFLGGMSFGVTGVVTGWLWGRLVAGLGDGALSVIDLVGVVGSLIAAPLVFMVAFRRYPLWWSAVTIRMRLAVLRGQTMQRRLPRTPAGEVVARSLDSDRFVFYVDRWVDVAIGVIIVLLTFAFSGSVLVGAVVSGVLLISAAASAIGAPFAGAAGRVAADRRARFGAVLVSALESVRTVKLAAATGATQAHLRRVDGDRVLAIIREMRIRMLLDGVPGVLIQAGVVTAWTLHLGGVWDLATTLLVTTTIGGLGWTGMVFGAAVTEAPIARRWLRTTAALAGEADLLGTPPGVDIITGRAPDPAESDRVPLRLLTLEAVTAVHDDGTVGVTGVDLTVESGSLVLLTGQVGAGKSSLLGSLAGLVDHEGAIRWNDTDIDDPQLFLRPGQVAYVAQVPRVLSGSFTDNVVLDHATRGNGSFDAALDDSRLRTDIDDAGGTTTLVGHRGVRLSGGQVQRLALARALATGAELLIADDVSSALDARTEVELWEALRRRGVTVVGASAKRAALARADRVVVLDGGHVAATGPWSELADRWGHLAG